MQDPMEVIGHHADGTPLSPQPPSQTPFTWDLLPPQPPSQTPLRWNLLPPQYPHPRARWLYPCMLVCSGLDPPHPLLPDAPKHELAQQSLGTNSIFGSSSSPTTKYNPPQLSSAICDRPHSDPLLEPRKTEMIYRV